MENFSDIYKQSLTREQRKNLISLLISEITFSEIWKIDTTKIQLNKDIIRYFLTKKREKSSSNDDFSLSFTIEL